jgi:hypothetical protein
MSNDKELFENYYENWLRNTILYSNPDVIFADENYKKNRRYERKSRSVYLQYFETDALFFSVCIRRNIWL